MVAYGNGEMEISRASGAARGRHHSCAIRHTSFHLVSTIAGRSGYRTKGCGSEPFMQFRRTGKPFSSHGIDSEFGRCKSVVFLCFLPAAHSQSWTRRRLHRGKLVGGTTSRQMSVVIPTVRRIHNRWRAGKYAGRDYSDGAGPACLSRRLDWMLSQRQRCASGPRAWDPSVQLILSKSGSRKSCSSTFIRHVFPHPLPHPRARHGLGNVALRGEYPDEPPAEEVAIAHKLDFGF
jgi:hypothetical protein